MLKIFEYINIIIFKNKNYIIKLLKAFQNIFLSRKSRKY